MSNGRQFVAATTSYVLENTWYPRAWSSIQGEPDAWRYDTHYFYTIQPYFNDFKILTDPGRDNSAVTSNEQWLRIEGANFWAVGWAYLFYDPRMVPPGYLQGAGMRSRYDAVVIHSKTLLANCAYEELGGGTAPGFQRWEFHPDGGIHNGTESFLFIDGHGNFHSTDPIEEYLDATSYPAVEYAYTYPPEVIPGEAEWWTMPSYPDHYPWKWGQSPRWK